MAVSRHALPTVFDDEPAYGWLARWAEMSGFPSPMTLAVAIGSHFRPVVSGQRNEAITAAAGLPAASFQRATFERMPDGTTACGGEILPRYDWNPNRLRLCPGCIDDDLRTRGKRGESTVHLRSWQMLFHMTVCPVHGLRLVEQFRGEKFRSFPMDLLRDAWPSGRLDPARLPREKVTDTAAEAYILGRLGFLPKTAVPILDRMPLQSAIRVMDRMGAVAVGGRNGYTHGSSIDQNMALNHGLPLFIGDGERFMALLTHLDATLKRRRASWGAAEVYGRAYRWLNEERSDPAYDEIRAMMRKHAHAHIALSPDVPFFGELIGVRQLYRLPHLYEASGIHMVKAHKILIAMGEVSPSVPDPLIPRDRALRIIELLKSSMTYNDARAFLGLGRGSMRYLLDTGAIEPSLRAGTEGLQEHLFLTSDLEELVRMCSGQNLKVLRKKPRGTGDFQEAALRSASSGAVILRLLKDGRIKPVGILKGKRGLGAVLINWKSVKAALEPRPDEVMTMVQAGKFLKVHFFQLRKLLDEGFLEATEYKEKDRKGTRARFLTRDSCVRFNERYVKAQVIAKRLGTHVRTLVPMLRKRGIEPAIDNEGLGRAGTYFYPADVVDRLRG